MSEKNHVSPPPSRFMGLRFSNVIVPDPNELSAIPDTRIMLPKKDESPVVRVGEFSTPVQSIPLMRGISVVMLTDVAVIEFASKIAVSWGRGTRAGVDPPDVVYQFDADQFTPPAVTM
jgi:hypothetical protein